MARLHPIILTLDCEIPLPSHPHPLTQLTQLFIDFFLRQGCPLRAQEIATIHQKKLCPKVPPC